MTRAPGRRSRARARQLVAVPSGKLAFDARFASGLGWDVECGARRPGV